MHLFTDECLQHSYLKRHINVSIKTIFILFGGGGSNNLKTIYSFVRDAWHFQMNEVTEIVKQVTERRSMTISGYRNNQDLHT